MFEHAHAKYKLSGRPALRSAANMVVREQVMMNLLFHDAIPLLKYANSVPPFWLSITIPEKVTLFGD